MARVTTALVVLLGLVVGRATYLATHNIVEGFVAGVIVTVLCAGAVAAFVDE